MKIPHGSFSHTIFNDSEVEIGKWTAIAANCIFHGADNHGSALNKKWVANNLDSAGHSKGKIIIGNDVWIGQGVRILSGVTIGDGAIIGAGAVIASDVPPYTIAVGNPWRVLRKRFTDDQIEKLLAIGWWDWGRELINERLQDFQDIDTFIQTHYVKIHKNDSH